MTTTSVQHSGWLKRVALVATALLSFSAFAHPHLWVMYVPEFAFVSGQLASVDIYLCYAGMPPMTCDVIMPDDVADTYLTDYPYLPRLFAGTAEITNMSHTVIGQVTRGQNTWRHERYTFPPHRISGSANIRFSLQSGMLQDPGFCQSILTGTNLCVNADGVALQKVSLSQFGLLLSVTAMPAARVQSTSLFSKEPAVQ